MSLTRRARSCHARRFRAVTRSPRTLRIIQHLSVPYAASDRSPVRPMPQKHRFRFAWHFLSCLRGVSKVHRVHVSGGQRMKAGLGRSSFNNISRRGGRQFRSRPEQPRLSRQANRRRFIPALRRSTRTWGAGTGRFSLNLPSVGDARSARAPYRSHRDRRRREQAREEPLRVLRTEQDAIATRPCVAMASAAVSVGNPILGRWAMDGLNATIDMIDALAWGRPMPGILNVAGVHRAPLHPRFPLALRSVCGE